MNFILCNEKCKHQKDGYCGLEGQAKITNAVTSSGESGCCYYECAGKSNPTNLQNIQKRSD